MPVVVIFIVQPEDRQTVGDELRSRRMRRHDVARLAERVGERRRVEIAPPIALARIGTKPESGPRGKSQNFTTSPIVYR